MTNQKISMEIKKKCCKAKTDGLSNRQIYDDIYKPEVEKPQAYRSFCTSLGRWVKAIFPDETTLLSGTYDGFTAHNATVQVSGNGEIVQAWIKQKANDIDPEEFIKAITDSIEPYKYKPESHEDSKNMLEIPLFDMHWGIAFMDHYESVLCEILSVIEGQHWKQIVIPFGQDFFHNDSIVNGQTTKGTQIEKVDMIRAVKEGKQFIYALIDKAIDSSDEVKVLYSPGNHDRSTAWMFMQVLLERYGPDIVDDSLEFRKVITYGKNSVMVTHGDSRRATSQNLAHIFPITFPTEFADSTTREVHSGHLHCEKEEDIFGVMVRRLSSGNVTDEWTNKEDFIGTHKRFMLFNWSLEKLNGIIYV